MASNIDVTVKGVESLNKAVNAIDKGTESSAKLAKQLRAVKEELATLDPNTARFQELAEQAGSIKDQMNDAAEAMNANAGTAFESLGNNASLLTQRLSNLDFEGVGQSVKGMAASIGRVSFKDISGGIKSMTSAFGALGKALLTNPIFLIAGVLALIATNLDVVAKIIPGVGTAMDSFSEAVTGVSAEMNKALEQSKKLTEEAQRQLDTTSASENILKLQGKSEKDILQIKIAQTKSVIDGLKAQITSQETINKAQVEAAKRNKEILKGVLQFITIPLQLLLGTIDEVGKALGQDFGLRDSFNENVSNLFFDPEQVKSEGDAALEEQKKQLLALENNVAGYQLSIQNINKQAADKRKAELEKAAAEEKKLWDEMDALVAQLEAETAAEEEASRQAKLKAEFDANEQRLKQQEDYYTLYNELNQTQEEKEIESLVSSYEAKFALAEGNAELELMLADQQAKDIAAINEKYRLEKEEKDKESAEKIAAFEKQKNAQKLQLASDAVGALLELNEVLQNGSEKSAKRAFVVNKALSLAQALTNTYLGANAAFAQTVGGIGIKIAAASVATVSGLANVAKIAKTKFNAGGGDSGGSSGGGGGASAPSFSSNESAANAPSFSAFNGSFLNNRPSQQAAPVQAYVLESNVSNSLEAVTKIKDKARL